MAGARRARRGGRWRAAFGAAWLGLASLASAAPLTYDLADCIETALHNNPDLSAAAARIALARAALGEAEARRYGQVRFEQQFGAVNGATGDILGPPKQNRNSLLEDLGPYVRGEIGLSVPIFTFGKLSSALDAAELGLRSETAGGEATRADVVLRVKQLYYGVLLSRMLGLVLHDMLADMDKAVAKTQQRLDAGSTSVTEIDLLKLQAGRARIASGVVDIDASSTLSLAALRQAMGLGDDTEIAIGDTRLEPVAAEIAPLAHYLETGPPRRPDVRQLRDGLDAQQAKVDRARAGYYPDLFFAGGFRYADAPNRTEQSNPFAYDNFNYTFPYVFLGVQWNLSLWQTNARVDHAQAELDVLRAQARRARSGIDLEIRTAYSDVERARETMRTTAAGRKAGRALLVLTVANFDLGIGEAEELFKGVGTYTEASTDHFRAVYDYNVAIATLGRSVGAELTALQYDAAPTRGPETP
ncbi:TolC family protein [bacterium]|nr:TolC family protein [bacterium]